MMEKPECDNTFRSVLDKKIMILDGAMGTMIMKEHLDENDFRGELFKDHGVALQGCNDILSLTRSDVIYSIHQRYLDAGADIIETNSFNCNRYSLADYGVENYAAPIAEASARVARRAADDYMRSTSRQVFVAGSIGPSSKSLTLAFQTCDSNVNRKFLTESYHETAEALLKGGVDIILIETIFDTLNAKCALIAVEDAMEKTGRKVPIIVSATLTGNGRMLSGMTLDGFMAAIDRDSVTAIMVNCGFGVDGMVEPLRKMQQEGKAVGIYPNAGLPDEFGNYTEDAATMAKKILPLLKDGLLNIVGGCCGTTPRHIEELAEIVNNKASGVLRRSITAGRKNLRLSGLNALDILSTDRFIKVGERCNVAGSRKFLRLIKEKMTDEAVAIAKGQIEAGAEIIDINLDDAMLDSKTEMLDFLRALAGDIAVADVPVMIDSADFNTLEAAMEVLQGRSIVNSISLKEGEEKFIERALAIKRHGAVPVVMGFDEQGQATDTPRRKEIFSRAYQLLTSPRVGYMPEEIIFDPNILAVCTGIEGHDVLARDFVEAVRWIKTTFPGVKVSGGVSNLSFAFRGNNKVREAMHAVFLEHAVKAGMDMAIVNPATFITVNDIDPELRDAIEEALFNNPCAESTERLIALASAIGQQAQPKETIATVESVKTDSQHRSPRERLKEKIVKADATGLQKLISECLEGGSKAMSLIDGPLMDAMNHIGELFGDGRLFLPQVVKSAAIMREAVTILTPLIEQDSRNLESMSKKIVLATVKGDVHDIGKNIVSVIMRCNGWDVIDMGVMVEPEAILDTAQSEGAVAIGLSGLITPSLHEMERVAEMMQHRGMTIPLLVGGATTTPLHTAVKIAPHYSNGMVAHTAHAAAMPAVAAALTGNDAASEREKLHQEQQQLRLDHEQRKASTAILTIEEARTRRHVTNKPSQAPTVASSTFTLDIAQLRPFINWKAFLKTWDLAPRNKNAETHSDMCSCGNTGKDTLHGQTDKLLAEASECLDTLDTEGATLLARVDILPAYVADDTIIVEKHGEEIRIPTPRQLKPNPDGRPQLALSDFLCDEGDFVGFFTVTTTGDVARHIETLKAQGKEFEAMLMQSLADRLVEAATEVMHHRVRSSLWGYAPHDILDAKDFLKRDFVGIRPAVGYPSLPDQKLVLLLDKILDYGDLGVTLTENGALYPQATTTGLLFATPEAKYFAL